SLYIPVTAWPLTANGKLDRRALPAPDMNAVTDADFSAPEGEVESALAAIWQELLGVGPISRHSDFFALGGHSLLAMRLASTIRDTFYMDFSLNKIFEQSVLHLQAGMIAMLIEENALSARLSANVQDTSEGFWL
ncbi:phosphopantetheine-binding protein, partial [Janthinobacterium sp. GMG1]